LGDDIRSCAHGNYVIFFAAAPEEVTIIRVLHGTRDIPAILAPDDGGQ
jgi:toxin ParE1/3/4